MKLATRVFLATAGVGLALVVVLLLALPGRPDAEPLAWMIMRAGAIAFVVSGILAWLIGRSVTAPLEDLNDAARAFAAGRTPEYPQSRVHEIARHALELRLVHQELAGRLAQLRREREDTRTLIESMSDGVVAANARGEVISSNTAARRLVGYRDDAALPPLGELFHDKPARDVLREALAGREVEQRALGVDDRELLVTARTLPDGGTLLVWRDVTELRRLETVRRDFVANVSHELKTPLTSIAGYAETLAAESRDPQTAKFTETILSNARRMQRLVDELLDLSRIESGGWQPVPRVIEIEPAARDAWTPFAERAASQQVAFQVDVKPDAHALPADPDALRQVFTNLFDNALRHTPPGGRIRVLAELVSDSVRLSVEDSGTGIPSDQLPRIFERFYRVDAGRARQEGGSGLGLAIVKHLVEAHGGRIEAESALGRGTAIRATFPANGTT